MQNPLNVLRHPRRLNVPRTRNRIEETIYPPEKLRLINVTIEQIDVECSEVDAHSAHIGEHEVGLAGHPGHQPGADIESRGNLNLATTLAIGGAAVQLYVNNGAFPDADAVSLVLASAGMELGFGALGFGVLRSINNRMRPEATIRAGRFMSLALTASVFAAGAVAAYMRFATDNTSKFVFDAAAVSLWWLAEALPFTAGLWFGLAHLRSYPSIVAAERRDLNSRSVELQRFRTWLIEQQEAVMPVESSKPTPTTPTVVSRAPEADAADEESEDRPVAAGVMPIKVASIALAMLIASSAASAQACGFTTERALIGVTVSRQQAIDLAMTRLDDFAARVSCRTMIVSSYTEAGAFSPRTAIEVPRRASRRDCTKVQPTTVDRSHATLRAFGAYAALLAKEAQTACFAEEGRRDSVFAVAWTRFVKDVRAIVAQDQVTGPTRVDITGLLKSYFDVGVKDVLMVGSGIDTSSGIPEHLSTSGVRALLVQYEAKDAFGGRAATDAAAERWRRAGVLVLPYPLLVTPAVFAQLAIAPTGG